MCLKLILPNTVLFEELHCLPLHLSLVQNNCSPTLTGLPSFISWETEIGYPFLPFHKVQWSWCKTIHSLIKASAYQESQDKKCILQNTYHKKMGICYNKYYWCPIPTPCQSPFWAHPPSSQRQGFCLRGFSGQWYALCTTTEQTRVLCPKNMMNA